MSVTHWREITVSTDLSLIVLTGRLPQFFTLFIGVTAGRTVKVPWKHLFRGVLRDGVLLVGYPLACSFRDPSALTKADLWTLVCAIYEGICHFRKISDGEREALISAWESGVKQGIYKSIPKCKRRCDVDEYRGRHLDAKTGRKKKGGWIHSDAMVPDGWDERN